MVANKMPHPVGSIQVRPSVAPVQPRFWIPCTQCPLFSQPTSVCRFAVGCTGQGKHLVWLVLGGQFVVSGLLK